MNKMKDIDPKTVLNEMSPRKKRSIRVFVMLFILAFLGVGIFAYTEDQQAKRLERLEIESSDQYHEQQRLDALEQIRMDSIAEVRKDSYRDSIQILKITTSKPNNEDGGIDLNIIWKNNSRKVINMISFKAIGVNSINEQVVTDYVKVSGPIQPNQISGKGQYWRSIWHNPEITSSVVHDVYIEFADGTYVDYVNQ